MNPQHTRYLACPECRANLILRDTYGSAPKEGMLECTKCGEIYPIIRGIPRFVASDNYAASFGVEWTQHGKTQYDSYTGTNISETRFFQETKWSRNLHDETILEVGSGAGRFTEQAAKTGAMVVSVEYSNAVEANYRSNGEKPNVLIAQGDVFKLPVKETFFDKVFCFGVLQHTPNPGKAFKALTRCLKSGGEVVIDVYRSEGGFRRFLVTKNWVRPITLRISPNTLYALCQKYVEFMWPLAKYLRAAFGTSLNWRLLIADYTGKYDLPDARLKEWALLDTFDMLSPKYDQPQSLQTVQKWFKDANLTDCEIHYGYNGIEAKGKMLD